MTCTRSCLVLAAFVTAALGCLRPPVDVSDCAALADPSSRDACLRRLLEGEIAATSLQQAIPLGSDPAVRDLLRMQLVVLEPWTAERLCPELESERARRWCRDIQARPHIWIRQRSGSPAPSTEPDESR